MNAPYLITAGGTGGHVFPALALSRELARRGEAVTFVTDARGRRFLPSDIAFKEIAAASPGGGIGRKVQAMWILFRGFCQSLKFMTTLRPKAIASFGGYASVPASLAALVRRVPLLVHEQNAVFGRANRLLGRFAQTIALSFDVTEALPGSGGRRVITGNPVRPGFEAENVSKDDARTRILIVGGSQGARILSDIVPAAIRALPQDLQSKLHIEQQCRAEDIERVRAAYEDFNGSVELATFFGDMPVRLGQADLVISRSGASSISEILSTGTPSLLIPYLYAADNHQHANALRLEEAGAAILMAQDKLSSAALSTTLEKLLEDPNRLSSMRDAALALAHPHAASILADSLLAIAKVGGAR